MDTIIPIARVWANPFTVPEPLNQRTAAAIKVVMLPSTIADIAFWKPVFNAFFTLLPRDISSRTRAKMMTLASTAMPILRMIPAIPGRVRVTLNAFNIRSTSSVYITSARLEASPGRKYTKIIKMNTMASPIAPAFRLVLIACSPNWAPTTLERSSSSSSFNPPIRMVDARFSASSYEKFPVMYACPPVIAVWTLGLLIASPS